MSGIVLSGSLTTPELALRLIASFEGCRLKPYRCPAGVLTIGIGHTNEAGGFRFDETTRITAEQALEIFRADIDRFEDGVAAAIFGLGRANVDIDLTPEQFGALVDLAFNIGLPKFKASTVLKKIKAGDLDAVPAQLMRWTKARVDGQLREVKGLVRRRRAACALWRGDLDDAKTYAGLEHGPMPQKVEAPRPPKRMAESTIGNGTLVGGAAGTLAAGKQAAEAVKETLATGQDLWSQLAEAGPWLLVALAVVCAAAYVWLERRRKLVEEHA